MSSDDQILENTVGSSGGVELPPRSGIARKKRSDAGQPRRSTLSALYDAFSDLPVSEQVGALEVLQELHRQKRRGKLSATPAEQAQIGESE